MALGNLRALKLRDEIGTDHGYLITEAVGESMRRIQTQLADAQDKNPHTMELFQATMTTFMSLSETDIARGSHVEDIKKMVQARFTVELD